MSKKSEVVDHTTFGGAIATAPVESASRREDPGHKSLTPDGLFLAALYGRDPAVQQLGRWFRADHLPPESMHCDVARAFQSFAIELLGTLEDSAEVNAALAKLIEAKDWAVRAAMS